MAKSDGGTGGNGTGPGITRRAVLTAGAVGATALAGGAAVWSWKKGLWLGTIQEARVGAATTKPPRVFDFRAGPPDAAKPLAIVTGPSPAALARQAVAALGGMQAFVKRGDKVLVKPNVGWDRTPEQAANTNPEIVAALCEMCFAAGAASVVVSDVTCNEMHRTFDASGIGKAARDAGAKVVFPRDAHLTEVDFNGAVVRSWPVYTHFFDVDRVINVPIAKQHSLSGLTLGMKNWFGVIGGMRARLHQDIHGTVADLATSIRPTLTVVDAFRILVGNGPQGGRPEDVRLARTVIASADPVAADAVAASLFGKKAQDLEYLRIAHARGLGEIDRSKMAVKEIALGT